MSILKHTQAEHQQAMSDYVTRHWAQHRAGESTLPKPKHWPNKPMNKHNQSDILSINQVQLLLSEKRTSLSVMRTGIAMLALPLSIFSALIATSKYYEITHVWPLLALVSSINLLLIAFSAYLIIRSTRRACTATTKPSPPSSANMKR